MKHVNFLFFSYLQFFIKLSEEIILHESLEKYKTFFENIRLCKPYELPEEIEQVLIQKSVTSSKKKNQMSYSIIMNH